MSNILWVNTNRDSILENLNVSQASCTIASSKCWNLEKMVTSQGHSVSDYPRWGITWKYVFTFSFQICGDIGWSSQNQFFYLSKCVWFTIWTHLERLSSPHLINNYPLIFYLWARKIFLKMFLFSFFGFVEYPAPGKVLSWPR